MPEIVEILKAASTAKLTNFKGEPFPLDFRPGLSEAEVNALEASAGLRFPEELKVVLMYCSGVDEAGWVAEIDFTGRMDWAQKDVFPHGIPIASDGMGNFWVIDASAAERESAPVYLANHDAPVILFQSPDLTTFVREVVRQFLPPHKSAFDSVYDDSAFNVWRKNPGVMSHADALKHFDPLIRKFAETLSLEYQFIDLRNAPVGFGFSWGRYGPDTKIVRCGDAPVFAYAKPDRKPGFFSKLFGG